MSNMIPLQAFVDKRLLPLVLTTLAALPFHGPLDPHLELLRLIVQAREPPSGRPFLIGL